MSNKLEEIAQQLITPTVTRKGAKPVPKVQLIYAFNGTGKTRLSAELKKLIDTDDGDSTGFSNKKFLYYNSFTEDLFYWHYQSGVEASPKLQAHENGFTSWIFSKQDLENRIDEIFKRVTGTRVDFYLDAKSNSIAFKMPEKTQILDSNSEPLLDDDGNPMAEDVFSNIKISKGEESNFKWSVFYVLLEQIITTLNDPENEDPEFLFDNLEYVFIDDPVSSLDENHLIELAVGLAKLVKSSPFQDGQGVRFIITTHNPLFYNVLHNEFNNNLYKDLPDKKRKCLYKRDQSKKYKLEKKADGKFKLLDSNDHPFSYHLFLLDELRNIGDAEKVERYHFNFLRNIIEKTATFLGYKQWNELLKKLPNDDQDVMERMLNLYSHSAHAGEEVADIKSNDKENLIKLIKDFTQTYSFSEIKENENGGTD